MTRLHPMVEGLKQDLETAFLAVLAKHNDPVAAKEASVQQAKVAGREAAQQTSYSRAVASTVGFASAHSAADRLLHVIRNTPLEGEAAKTGVEYVANVRAGIAAYKSAKASSSTNIPGATLFGYTAANTVTADAEKALTAVLTSPAKVREADGFKMLSNYSDAALQACDAVMVSRAQRSADLAEAAPEHHNMKGGVQVAQEQATQTRAASKFNPSMEMSEEGKAAFAALGELPAEVAQAKTGEARAEWAEAQEKVQAELMGREAGLAGRISRRRP